MLRKLLVFIALVLSLVIFVQPASLQEADAADPNSTAAETNAAQKKRFTAAQKKRFTLAQTSNRVPRNQRVNVNPQPALARFIDDGTYVVVDGQEGRLNVATLETETYEPNRQRQPDPTRRAFNEFVIGYFDIAEDDRARAAARNQLGRIQRRGDAAIARIRGHLLYWHKERGVKVLIDPDVWQYELEKLSPDGEVVSFVNDGDMGFIEARRGMTDFATSDADPDIVDGKLDWMYQEEIYGRGRWNAHWWSPDSQKVAFLTLDQREVNDFTVIDHIPGGGDFGVGVDTYKYPKAGTTIPRPYLAVHRFGMTGTLWTDLSKYAETDILITNVNWSPTGVLTFQVQDRIQRWLELNRVDLETGKIKTLLREQSNDWVDTLSAPRWLNDGSFIWYSQRSGFAHYYHYSAEGDYIGTITKGGWSAARIAKLQDRTSEKNGATLWLYGNKERNVNRDLYRVELDGKDFTRLTSGDGWHDVDINSDGSAFIDTWSAIDVRPVRLLCDGKDGSVRKVLSKASGAIEEQYEISTWKLHRIPCRDGFEIDIAILKPTNFDENKRYPVWMPIYGGPDLPTIRNRWRDSTWNQFLAQQGYIIMTVNVRSAGHNGHAVAATAYERLGASEFRDLEDAAKWIGSQPWADESKIGITGFSYGGYMSAYCLARSDKWALAIAGGGLYDWRGYDAVYAERYMNTPQANKKGYDEASVLTYAKGLSGHLVITHGTMDENVHVQSALKLAYALQKAGKQNFEMMLYPKQRHGYRDGDIRWFERQRAWDRMQTYLTSPMATKKRAATE